MNGDNNANQNPYGFPDPPKWDPVTRTYEPFLPWNPNDMFTDQHPLSRYQPQFGSSELEVKDEKRDDSMEQDEFPAQTIMVECPHCGGSILIFRTELNCRIFRHAVFKASGVQINPHTAKDICDLYREQGHILGCGKPFEVVCIGGKEIAQACEYK